MSTSMEYLKITAYSDKDFSTLTGSPYATMINPDTLKWNRAVEYNEQQAQDSSAPSQTYKRTPADTLQFEIVIDCTGVVDPARLDMSAEIAALKAVVFEYNGNIHRPNFVHIQWGRNFVFKGVLTSFDISYTLFRPNGDPLRARVSMAYNSYAAPAQVQALERNGSPDVSHLVTITEGDTLPAICNRLWSNPLQYIGVARYNRLNKFRVLKPQSVLIFPPLLSKQP